MNKKARLEGLDASVAKQFERYASNCLVRALSVCLSCSVLVAAVSFLITDSKMLGALVFGVCGVIGLNGCFLFFVPSNKSRSESRKLLLIGANDPTLIEDIRPGVTAIRRGDDDLQELSAIELKIWKESVVPFLCKLHSATLAEQKAETGRVMTSSEIRQLKQQREALEEAQSRLASEQDSLQAAKAEIEQQAKSLQDAEELVISRLSEVEVAEAEMAQMRDDLSSAQATSVSSADDEERLMRKEAELDTLRISLQQDKQAVEMQKTELNQLKGDLICAQQSHDGPQLSTEDGLSERERSLEEQRRQLQEAQKELEERTQYVDEVENSLIDRLNQMSEREAHVEQSEINAGLRMD